MDQIRAHDSQGELLAVDDWIVFASWDRAQMRALGYLDATLDLLDRWGNRPARIGEIRDENCVDVELAIPDSLGGVELRRIGFEPAYLRKVAAAVTSQLRQIGAAQGRSVPSLRPNTRIAETALGGGEVVLHLRFVDPLHQVVGLPQRLPWCRVADGLEERYELFALVDLPSALPGPGDTLTVSGAYASADQHMALTVQHRGAVLGAVSGSRIDGVSLRLPGDIWCELSLQRQAAASASQG